MVLAPPEHWRDRICRCIALSIEFCVLQGAWGSAGLWQVFPSGAYTVIEKGMYMAAGEVLRVRL